MKKKMLFFMLLLTAVLLPACSLKKTEEAQTGTTRQPNEPEASETPEKVEGGDKEPEQKEEPVSEGEPDFIYEGQKLDGMSYEFLLDMNTNEQLCVRAPAYQVISGGGGKFLYLADELLIVMSDSAYTERTAKSNAAEEVMDGLKESLQMDMNGLFKGSRTYKELVVETEEEEEINGVTFNHFTGYFKGSKGSVYDEELLEEENGLTYYAEGYVYLHTNGKPVLIMGVVLGDNEKKHVEFYGRDDYPEHLKEDMTHNLYEMMKTMQYKEDY